LGRYFARSAVFIFLSCSVFLFLVFTNNLFGANLEQGHNSGYPCKPDSTADGRLSAVRALDWQGCWKINDLP